MTQNVALMLLALLGRKGFLMALVCALAYPSLSTGADEVHAPPTGPVVLTVSGQLEAKNAGENYDFDRGMLLALAQHKIVTSTPWTDSMTTFEGPLLRDVLDQVGARGDTLDASALNDYRIQIPRADARQYPVIVALKMNGEELRVRTKGPLWIIYPWSEFPELQAETYYQRSIWQLRRIAVH
ncbi:MAG: molybdopterin-dependent oxidoreductase [Gammaproteobacteria bacterium]